jgi:hypothetical protein
MNREFEVHMLNETGKARARAIAEHFDALLAFLTTGPSEAICPPGRETSILRTKLEEACFFAKKAMASQPVNTVNESEKMP